MEKSELSLRLISRSAGINPSRWSPTIRATHHCIRGPRIPASKMSRHIEWTGPAASYFWQKISCYGGLLFGVSHSELTSYSSKKLHSNFVNPVYSIYFTKRQEKVRSGWHTSALRFIRYLSPNHSGLNGSWHGTNGEDECGGSEGIQPRVLVRSSAGRLIVCNNKKREMTISIVKRSLTTTTTTTGRQAGGRASSRAQNGFLGISWDFVPCICSSCLLSDIVFRELYGLWKGLHTYCLCGRERRVQQKEHTHLLLKICSVNSGC
eukprot:scaffold2206_cov95-Cylindrotheca_fusiformis.AAC.5